MPRSPPASVPTTPFEVLGKVSQRFGKARTWIAQLAGHTNLIRGSDHRISSSLRLHTSEVIDFAGARLGLQYGTVRLVRADARWMAIADQLAADIRAVLGGSMRAVEHIERSCSHGRRSA